MPVSYSSIKSQLILYLADIDHPVLALTGVFLVRCLTSGGDSTDNDMNVTSGLSLFLVPEITIWRYRPSSSD